MIELKFIETDDELLDNWFILLNGKRIGTLQAELEDSSLVVEDVQVEGGPGSLGPRRTRELLRAVKSKYPTATEIRGLRLSGARKVPTETAVTI